MDSDTQQKIHTNYGTPPSTQSLVLKSGILAIQTSTIIRLKHKAITKTKDYKWYLKFIHPSIKKQIKNH
jgi:hypothetical protein